MAIEGLIAGLVVGVALLPLAAAAGRRWPAVRRWSLLVPPLAFVAVLAVARVWPRGFDESQVLYRPVEIESAEYTSSDACQACHPRPYATWHDSYHRTMTQTASLDTVAADEDSHEFIYGYQYAWKRIGEVYWVASDDPAWRQYGSMSQDQDTPGFTQRPIVMATGSHHEQVYWFRTGNDRQLRVFPFIYRIEEERWLPWSTAFLMPELPPEKLVVDWNQACVFCHTTDPRPGLWGHGEVDTKVTEFGIACESCHGPAKEHALVNRDPTRRYRLHLGEEPDPTIVNPADLDARRASEVCGSCHSYYTGQDEAQLERVRISGYHYRPGDVLSETRNIVRAEEEDWTPATRALLEAKPGYLDSHFWGDGTAIINGREYNAVTRSPCYAGETYSCMSCHQMHQQTDDPRSREEWADDQLKVGMRGDAGCLQCHPAFADALEEHTHHPAGSEGSRCYNCHMPNTVYGMLKATRDHEVRSPSAQETLASGRPNACNLCHLDRTLEWTSQQLESWYGIEPPEITDPEHQRTALGPLQLLRGNAVQRAFIAWHMGWDPARKASGEDWIPPLLAQLLEDPYPAVRQIADRSLRSIEGYEEIGFDALSSSDERSLGRWRVWETWEKARRSRPRNGHGDAVLLDPDGLPQMERLNRLLSQRDDRFLYLEE